MKNMSRNGTNICPGPDSPLWAPIIAQPTALVTGAATTVVNDPMRCDGSMDTGTEIVQCPSYNPFQLTLTGAPFDCDNWVTDNGAKLLTPSVALNEDMDLLGVGDIAQVLKLADN
jgi:hypothetical protein